MTLFICKQPQKPGCFSDGDESNDGYTFAVRSPESNSQKKVNAAVAHSFQILTDNAHLKMST